MRHFKVFLSTLCRSLFYYGSFKGSTPIKGVQTFCKMSQKILQKQIRKANQFSQSTEKIQKKFENVNISIISSSRTNWPNLSSALREQVRYWHFWAVFVTNWLHRYQQWLSLISVFRQNKKKQWETTNTMNHVGVKTFQQKHYVASSACGRPGSVISEALN